MDLSLYLRPDTPVDVQSELKKDLEAEANVAYVVINSKEDNLARLESQVDIDEATRELIEESGESLSDILPVSIGIHVLEISDIDNLIAIVNGDNSKYQAFLDANSFEKQFFQGDSQKTVQNMTNMANTIQIIGFILGGVFLFITILVIFNTIRLAIFARREEIEMEKLIGAERSYVRGPFLIEAELYGIISGVLALGLGYVLVLSFLPSIWTGEVYGGVSTAALNNIMINLCPLVVIAMIIIGIVIGNLSARLAVKKYLRY
jgi:cell division transport system permease protein